ncbi:MAG: DUF1574 domain-containing protein [Bacteroidales bacterium]|nr:DUF1574 domain-containing protein [Saprospiraceae bacterium]MCF8381581.1 DUF1574 domain-containing protein [Bacteroidales bacterium]
MKPFLKKIGFFSLFPILLMLSINYIYDPANLFDPDYKYERSVANYLNEGWNVTNVGNMDERIFQKYFIEGMKQSPDVVIMGSSNSMYIDSSFYPNQKLINNAVSSATFIDFMAIYELYERKGFKPKKVVIGIDPYMLVYSKNEFWKSYQENYISMRLKMDSTLLVEVFNYSNSSTYKWKELFSLSYFQSSIKLINNSNNILPVKKQFNEAPTKVCDGSFNAVASYKDKTKSQIELGVMRYIGGVKSVFNESQKIDSENRQHFELFVQYLLDNDVGVEFYFIPYHPLYYNYIVEKYLVIREIEDYLAQYAKNQGIRVTGSLNPTSCGLTSEDFTDYSHINLEGFNKLFLLQEDTEEVK